MLKWLSNIIGAIVDTAVEFVDDVINAVGEFVADLFDTIGNLINHGLS
jgi:cell shape-determining protein MreC